MIDIRTPAVNPFRSRTTYSGSSETSLTLKQPEFREPSDQVTLSSGPDDSSSLLKLAGGTFLLAPLVAGAVGGAALVPTTLIAGSGAIGLAVGATAAKVTYENSEDKGVGAVLKSGAVGLTAGAVAAAVSFQALLFATLPPLGVLNAIFSTQMVAKEAWSLLKGAPDSPNEG